MKLLAISTLDFCEDMCLSSNISMTKNSTGDKGKVTVAPLTAASSTYGISTNVNVVPHTRFIQNALKVAGLISHGSGKHYFILSQSAASGDNEELHKLPELLSNMINA